MDCSAAGGFINTRLTQTQVSAGGVVYRKQGETIEIALISVGEELRWQLPKGTVNTGESLEGAALREVREETGLEAEIVAPLERVEYWYVGKQRGGNVRFHKFVHFYLMRYVSGEVADHDHEVNEARWVEIQRALEWLAFKGEKKVAQQAAAALHLA